MSAQYGNPDWAEPSAPKAEAPEGNNASAWTASSGGEDFSAAAAVNASGSGNHRQVKNSLDIFNNMDGYEDS